MLNKNNKCITLSAYKPIFFEEKKTDDKIIIIKQLTKMNHPSHLFDHLLNSNPF